MSPYEVLNKSLIAQKDLNDFSAAARATLELDRLTVPVSVHVYAKRPSKTAVKVLGIMVRQSGAGGFVLPAPEIFLEPGAYRLSVAAPAAGDRQRHYAFMAIPVGRRPGLISWRLEVSRETWLIEAAEAWDDRGNWSRMEARYQMHDKFCWVPVSLEGSGSLLLKNALPSDFLDWVISRAEKNGPVRFSVQLSDIKVNEGLPDEIF